MRLEDYPQTLKVLNNIINNDKVAEVKIEHGNKLVVVETSRIVRNSVELKEENNG